MNISKRLLFPFKGDKAIWVIFIVLCIFSLVAVYSASGATAVHLEMTPEKYLVSKHLVFLLATFIIVIGVANMDYRKFSQLSWFGYIISIVLLLVSFVISLSNNSTGSGASRWLTLPFGKSFQPSEFAKVVLIVYLARRLTREKETLHESKTFRNIIISISFIIGLIVLDNLSTALIIGIICFILLRFAPIDVKKWWKAILVYLLLGATLIIVGSTLSNTPLSRADTWIGRTERWLHDDYGEQSQEYTARIAIASGKLIGNGIGSTIQARLLPEATNDFIYSIIMEETGMLGGTVVFLLYLILYLRCIKVAWNCRGSFGRLMVTGLSTLIFLQAAIHMGVNVGAFPTTGQTLPFISSGGTSMLCMGLALGLIQSVAFSNEQYAV